MDLQPPLTDGGAQITSYKVDWDSNPGVHEVQAITTSAYVGPNEIQTITTSALVHPEVQVVTTSSTHIAAVQRVVISGGSPGGTLGGQFFLSLDTKATGGSAQYTGYIAVNAPPHISPANNSRTSVEDIISALSNVDGRVVVTPHIIDSSTYEYRVTFPLSMGNVPLMTANTDELMPLGVAQVNVYSVSIGNILSGTFRLGFEGDNTVNIPFDATEEELTSALEALPSVGAVTVSRSTSDFQRGYSWSVTFGSPMNSGNIPAMSFDKSGLVTSNPTATTTIAIVSYDGNQLGGAFSLSFTNTKGVLGTTTIPIAFNAEAFEVVSALEKMSNNVIPAGSVAVTRTGPDGQLGYTWTVQFLDNYNHTFSGLLNNFAPTYSSTLTGLQKSVTVVKLRPGTVKEVQLVSITNSAPYNSSLYMAFQFDGMKSIGIPLQPSAAAPYCVSAVTEVQSITSSSVNTQQTQSQGDGQVSHYTMFRLSYGSEVTPWVTANPLSSPGDCSLAAAAIKSGLETFTEFFKVVVTYAKVPDASQSCVWTVSFVSSQGPLSQLKVQTKNTASKMVDPAFGYSSTVGDDTLKTAVSVVGKLDAIKAALELLPNVGSVTVTADSSVSSSTKCAWKVTFDTKAGSVSFPQLLVHLYTNHVGVNQSSFAFTSTANYLSAQAVVTNLVHGTSSPLGGYFALTFNGARTGYLPYNSGARDVAEALMNLDTVGDVNVVRSMTDENNGYTWTVTFLSELGPLSDMIFDSVDLTGTVATGVVSKLVQGVFPPFNSLDQTNGLPLGSAVITNTNDMSLLVDSLEQGIAYYFRASAINSVGQGPYGYSPIPFAIPEPQRPSAPTNATVSNVDGTSVSVSFDSPLLDGGEDVTFYKIEYGPVGFVPEIQQVSVLCDVVPAVQVVTTSTSHATPAVQLIHIDSSYRSNVKITHDIQFVQCDASGGSFRLQFAGQYTPPISYNAKQADIKNALLQIDVINDVSVTFTGGLSQACTPNYGLETGFNVTFIDVTHMAGNLPVMSATTNSLSGLRRIDITHYPGNAPLGGSFRLSFMGSISQQIPVNASAAQLTFFLENLDTIPTGGVVVSSDTYSQSGPCSGCIQWRVTFVSPDLGGDIDALEVVDFYNYVSGSGQLLSVFSGGLETVTQRGGTAPSVRGNQVGGQFTLSFRGYTTDPIEYNAADTVVKAALEQLSNIGTVTVVRSGPSVWQEYAWTVTFDSMPGAFPIGSEVVDQMIPIFSNSLLGTGASATVTTISSGTSTLSGYFNLQFTDNQATTVAGGIPVDASASELEAALNALSNMGTVSVSRTMLANGYKWLVTFNGCKIVNGIDVCNEGLVDLFVATNHSSCPLLVTKVCTLLAYVLDIINTKHFSFVLLVSCRCWSRQLSQCQWVVRGVRD